MVSFSPDLASAEIWLRGQWLGIAYAPAAYVHVSHTLLTLTGLTSRGRRSWGVRFLYGLATLFFVLVVLGDSLVRNAAADPAPHLTPGPVFPIFLFYFLSSVALSVWFILRARQRTLTVASRRRISYLLLSYAAPALAVFPFLLISGQSNFSPGVFYTVLVTVDIVIVVMLSLLSYVLAVFGSLQPDRLVKAQMLQFFLRGPSGSDCDTGGHRVGSTGGSATWATRRGTHAVSRRSGDFVAAMGHHYHQAVSGTMVDLRGRRGGDSPSAGA